MALFGGALFCSRRMSVHVCRQSSTSSGSNNTGGVGLPGHSHIGEAIVIQVIVISIELDTFFYIATIIVLWMMFVPFESR